MKANANDVGLCPVSLVPIVLLVALLAVPASADISIDGRFDPSEGYTLGVLVDFAVDGVTGTVGGGQLWAHQAANGDVSLAFIQPLTLVDNTYGDNAVGWGSAAPSGKNHTFSNLKGSDDARFTFTDGQGNRVLDVTMDYFSEKNGQYSSLGVTGGDGHVHAGSAGDVLAWGTSLDYNFNDKGYKLTQDSPVTDTSYTPDPNYPDWVYEVTYELRVSGDLFAANGFGSVVIPTVHDSPNKIGGNLVQPSFDIGKPIPAPGALCLGLIGLAAVGWVKRRRAG